MRNAYLLTYLLTYKQNGINLDTFCSLSPAVCTSFLKHGVTLLVLATAATSPVDSPAFRTPSNSPQRWFSEVHQHRLQMTRN